VPGVGQQRVDGGVVPDPHEERQVGDREAVAHQVPLASAQRGGSLVDAELAQPDRRVAACSAPIRRSGPASSWRPRRRTRARRPEADKGVARLVPALQLAGVVAPALRTIAPDGSSAANAPRTRGSISAGSTSARNYYMHWKTVAHEKPVVALKPKIEIHPPFEKPTFNP